MNAIKRGETWIPLDEAARRVNRSARTLQRWQTQGLITIWLGRVDEHNLMAAQRAVTAKARRRIDATLQASTVMRTLGNTIPDPRPPATKR